MSEEDRESQGVVYYPNHKSTFSAYVKPELYDSKTVRTESFSDDVMLEIRKRQKLLKRQTDGYFNDNSKHPNGKKANKRILKNVFARRATYLPKVDKVRISMGIVEEYKEFPISYVDLGYGVIINIIAWTFSCYMAGFCAIMRFFGGIQDNLERKYSSANVGYGMMAFSNIFSLLTTIYIKCNPQIDFSIAVMVRGLIATILIFQMAHVKGQELTSFPKHDLQILIYRGSSSAFAMIYFFYALGKLPLSINMIISNTGPVFIFILSVLFFNGKMLFKDVVGIVVSLLGVFCVSNPSYLQNMISPKEEEIPGILPETKELNGSQESTSSKYHYEEGAARIIILCIYLAMQAAWGYGVLLVKELKKANTLSMNFFVSIGFTMIGAFAFLYRPPAIFDISYSDIVMLLLTVGLCSFVSQYTFITSTFLNHNHGPLTMLGYLSVVMSYFVQVVFFNEIPCISEIIGSILVLIGVAKIVIN